MAKSERTAELCRPENEAEALALEAELREHGIAPLLMRAGSTAYPGLIDRGRWGAIRVAEDDFERAREIAGAWLARDEEEMDEEELARQAIEAADIEEAERRRAELAPLGSPYRAPDATVRRGPVANAVRKISFTATLAAFSLVLNIGLALWIVHLRGAAGQLTTQITDAHGSTVDEWAHRQDPARPSRGRRYDVEGRQISEVIDEDADGREERARFFDRTGRMTLEAQDANEDGWYDSCASFDRDGLRATTARDSDQDGIFEEVRVLPGVLRSRMLLRDRNGDGFFETLVCGAEETTIRCQ